MTAQVASVEGVVGSVWNMMFQGSAHVGADEYFSILGSRGAKNINGVTTLDRTVYYETVPSHELELALWAESDRMAFLLTSLSEKSLAEQKKVVLNERRQRTVDRPYGQLDALIMRTMFPKPHPYSGNVIGRHQTSRKSDY